MIRVAVDLTRLIPILAPEVLRSAKKGKVEQVDADLLPER